ncbi:MAG TPA: tRNA 2-thiouridine(34) synthase MnmA [Candidatus Marinimicrobia bacterium]|nr:tRNA 2-thiouridine(34) synthase MnmA [Candidatus Neomarinimicrobiota bacterium]
MANDKITLVTKKQKVLVALSGGVDSAVAAWVLCQEGYEPVGITFRMWRMKEDIAQAKAIDRARQVCEILKIPHIIFDLNAEFEEQVVKPFVNEYFQGLTPNPCVNCNRVIKWHNLQKIADQYGIEKIATGHYARLKYNSANKRYQILKGVDSTKDQSYALWQIPQTALKRTLFPLGEMTKNAVKTIAVDHNLIVGKITESQNICFIPEGDYRSFLKEYAPQKVQTIGRGELVDERGRVLGWHNGFYNFTIGQRKGFRVGFKERRYVKAINAPKNRVVIAPDKSLFSSKMIIKNVNWVGISAVAEFDGIIKIRYNHPGAMGHGKRINDNEYEITFIEPQRAICPGQSAVVYQDDCLLMGGIIQ